MKGNSREVFIIVYLFVLHMIFQAWKPELQCLHIYCTLKNWQNSICARSFFYSNSELSEASNGVLQDIQTGEINAKPIVMDLDLHTETSLRTKRDLLSRRVLGLDLNRENLMASCARSTRMNLEMSRIFMMICMLIL